MSEIIRASGTSEFIERLAELASRYPGVIETEVSANGSGIRIEYTGEKPRQTVIEDLKQSVEFRYWSARSEGNAP